MTSTAAPDTSTLEDHAGRALRALRDEDYEALVALVDPDAGLVFSPDAHLRDDSVRLSRDEVGQLASSDQVYRWGYEPSAFPIELTFADCREKYLWNRDYTEAPVVVVDEVKGYSSAEVNTISEYFGPAARWVEYSFPSTVVDPDGVDHTGDWTALRLVFRETDTGFLLIGIIHAFSCCP